MEGFITNLDIFIFVADTSSFSKPNVLFDKFASALSNLSEEESKVLKQFCQTYVCNLRSKWISCNRTRPTFIKKHISWLQNYIIWPELIREKMTPIMSEENCLPPDSNRDIPINEGASTSGATSTCSVGTSTSTFSPRKPFDDISPRQKKRRVEELLVHNSTECLAHATALSANNPTVAEVIKTVIEHPEQATRIKEFLKPQKKTVPIYSADKALGIYTSLKLSKWQYITLRSCAIAEGVSLYPAYSAILEITETGVRVKLQALLDLTISRLSKFVHLSESLEGKCLKLICKWGFDGASGQSNYKQSMSGEDDSSVFMCSMVPLRLVCDGENIWENTKPCSTMLCRPMYFKFANENKLNILEEQALVEAEIGSLVPSKMGNNLVTHEMLMTMIDGKITSQLSKTSTQTCDICKAVPSEMNNLEKLSKKRVSEDIYRYGLSTLHAWIRCMECLLHIAYRLDFKTWQARDTAAKDLLKIRKHLIQEKFRNEMGLLVDIVKQGAGNTNDGNTARKFFENPEKTAEITGLDASLIGRFATILRVVASGERINSEAFDNYAKETAQKYVELYVWYNMPASVHKLLWHGAKIIEHFNMMPIGKLSEEASEARNKDFKKIREGHSRKFCRKATNEDVFHGLLVSSDPYLSSIRPVLRKSHKSAITDDMKFLIIADDNDDSGDKENLEFVEVNASFLDSDLENSNDYEDVLG